jgi:hypothetical protein
MVPGSMQEWELPDILEALDPRSTPNSLAASCLPAPLLAELEEVQSIGGVSHLTGVSNGTSNSISAHCMRMLVIACCLLMLRPALCATSEAQRYVGPAEKTHTYSV